MTDKKWYSVEDIELAKAALDELPDLTPTRLTRSDVLEQLKDKIVELSLSKRDTAWKIYAARWILPVLRRARNLFVMF